MAERVCGALHLDFDRGVIHVRKTKTKLNRVVPMNRRVREVFNKQKRSSE